MWRCFGMLVVLLGATAHATCWLRQDSTCSDGGWMSPITRLDCDCSDCPTVRLEVRPASGSYGGAGSFDRVIQRVTGYPFFTVTDGQPYYWRATPQVEDGGVLATTAEQLVTADWSGPTIAGAATASVIDAGMMQVSFGAATDPGCGVYMFQTHHALVGRPDYRTNIRWSATSPAVFALAPGTWITSVSAHDCADNEGAALYAPEQVTIAADPGVAVPPPPFPDPAPASERGRTVRVADPADSYVVVADHDDGGTIVVGYAEPAPAGTAFGVWITEECRYTLRWSRIVNGRPSDWSLPSAPFIVDLFPPTAVTLSGTSTDETVQLSWDTSTDNCSGLAPYRVERDDGTGFTEVARPSMQNFVDTLPTAGSYWYRVVAVDQAARESLASNVIQVVWLGPDAGSTVDAGLPDAGAPDAGTADAGTPDAGAPDAGSPDAGVPPPGPYAVGCGCGASGAEAGLLALLALLSRRRRTPYCCTQ